jgi:hypothetical protein
MGSRVGVDIWGRKEISLTLSGIEQRCPNFPAPNLFVTHTALSLLTDSLAKPNNILSRLTDSLAKPNNILSRLTDSLTKPNNILNPVNNAQWSTDLLLLTHCNIRDDFLYGFRYKK